MEVVIEVLPVRAANSSHQQLCMENKYNKQFQQLLLKKEANTDANHEQEITPKYGNISEPVAHFLLNRKHLPRVISL